MPTIKPFRVVDEHDVFNLYAYSGTIPVTKGTFVKIGGSGYRASDEQLIMLGNVGSAIGNTVAQRYGVLPKVTATASGENPFGMLLYDVRNTDENSENLIFNPRKRQEMQCVLSGQAVPIVTKGMFLYSGVLGSVSPGQDLYADDSGGLRAIGATGYVVAKALGSKDDNGLVLIKLDL